MSIEANATFEIKSWDEQPFSEVEQGGKLTRASIIKTYTGDIEGEGVLEYLMAYRMDGSASFTGLERVVGSIGNKSGSFVLRHSGVFEDGVARDTIEVVAGSGTGELRGLKGEGGFSAGHQQEFPITLNYEFA